MTEVPIIETSPLSCSAKQWTGFSMIGPFVVNELKKMNSIARFLKISKQKSLYSNETWIKINN